LIKRNEELLLLNDNVLQFISILVYIIMNDKEFIEKIKINNSHFSKWVFIILWNYTWKKNRILIENKYWKLNPLAESIMKWQNPWVQVAVNKNEYILNQFKEIHWDKYSYDMVNYQSSFVKVRVRCKNHWIFSILPSAHLQWQWCRHCALETKHHWIHCWYKQTWRTLFSFYKNNIISLFNDNTPILFQDRIDKINDIYGNIYEIKKWLSWMRDIAICNCIKHWYFEKTFESMIDRKIACPWCYKEIKRNNIKNKINEVHWDRYTYNNIIYNKKEYLSINCKEHWIFQQIWLLHINRWYWCPICAHQNSWWKLSDWEWMANKSNNFDSYKLYIIKITWDDIFYKIWITFNTLKNRFISISKLWYKIEELKIIESKDVSYIYNLEKKLLREHKEYRYNPMYSFWWETECFSYIDRDIINDNILW
jgi:hypothetical protein